MLLVTLAAVFIIVTQIYCVTDTQNTFGLGFHSIFLYEKFLPFSNEASVKQSHD